MVYSFDVYNTLITRITDEPTGIFVYMQKIMSDSDSYSDLPFWFVEDFVRIRKESEIIARKKTDYKEITLTDIYTQMADNHNVSGELCQKISELEIEVEIKCSVVIQENIEKIEKLIQSGNRVLLITDMYMDRDFFEKLFSHVHPALNKYPLYISSESGATKSSGLLFALVATKEHISLKEWTHIGDNVFSDVEVPQLLGIKATLFQKRTDTFASSRIHAVFSDMDNVSAQYLMGIQNNNEFLTRSTSYKIGYSFLGMILYEYVNWVIRQALEMGVETLHFIARDGYILKRVAEVIIKEEGLSIQTNYLYGSRKAWRTTSDAERELASAYLRQEVLGREGRFAFVDAQGTGLSLDMMPRLMDEQIPIFYYTSPIRYKSKNTKKYIYSLQTGRRLIEVFCRAPHGMTIGYAKERDKIIPLIAPSSDKKYVECGFHDYVDGVVDFVKDLQHFQRQIGISFSLAGPAQCGMWYCENRPDIQLANFIGEIPFGSLTDNAEITFAPLLSEQDIKRIEFDRRQEPLHKVFYGEDLDYAYSRLSKREKKMVDGYRKDFYQQAVSKATDAVHIVIIGCGYYGEEMYRLFYLDEAVIVDKMVDVYPNRDKCTPFNVESILAIKEVEFDYLVISNDRTTNARAITMLLALSGIEVEKVISEKAFLSMYRKEN